MASRLLFCLVTFPVFALSDNVPPEFDRSEYIVNDLKEKSPIGTRVLNVTATDVDGDEVTYVLVGAAKSKFLINNKTGEIFVNAVLTNKEYPDRISFEVSAYDSTNGPDYKVSAAVYILLEDINDNSPRFVNKPYVVNVPENTNIGRIIFQVTAEDDDTSKFGLISYSIDSGNKEGKFAITTYTGHISVVDLLSFDKTTKYTLNISATDGGGKMDNTTVVINVLDYDNLPAVFDKRTYLASVREDSPLGFSVIQVSARDGDSLNASVEYILDPVSDKNYKFAVNNSTGIITVNGSLDRETTASYLLRIGAKSTYHVAVYTTVSVQVLDVNDNGPVFERSLYEAFVPENSPVDLTVLQVIATDADVGENATLQYLLSGARDKFAIRSTGHIIVKANVDREERSQYVIVVTAEETSTPERYQSNATVIINITDVNDHNPKCSQDIYKVIVDENRPNGTFVTQVVGIDLDAGKNAEIRFSFESELDGHVSYFALDAVTGNITTLRPLDRETNNMFTLSVTLRDQAEIEQKRSGSCFVQISVGDQNDNIPKFISLLNGTSVAEDAPPGTTVVIIKAQDADESNALVKYYIVSGNVENTFNLNVTSGVLSTSKILDRESIDEYNLVVNATDSGGMSQTEVVIVSVLDKNDNSPRFHQPQGYWFTVDENSAALLVGIVQATDEDLGVNADVVYSIEPSLTSNRFTIESATGTIKTAVPLDRETVDSYTLLVKAADKGAPSLVTNVSVHVDVSDVNDNRPGFSQEHYTVGLAENRKSHVFLNLTASDKDLGINSKLRYSILSGNSEGYFSVYSTTGALSTTKSLDFEKNQMFTLLLQVHDLDGNETYGEPFQDNSVVYISVKDVNDHAPVFSEPQYSVRLYENKTTGSEMILVRATDKDSGVNKVVEYSFVHGNELGKFFIDASSGRVTIKGTIDRDPPYNQTSFNITVLAKDNGIPSLNSTTQLFILVEDSNDNAPVFSKSQYRVQLLENSAPGTVLIKLDCIDVDLGENGMFLFMIKSGVDQVKPEFLVDNITGVIRSLINFDYDLGIHEYTLVVEAMDRGQPQLVGSTTVVINIENVNDNSPWFSQSSYSFSIREGSYVGLGQPVGRVEAIDLDYDGESSYGQVLYSLVNGSSLFSVNNLTGEISTNKVLDREQNSRVILEIMAQDRDQVNPRSNITAVYIAILDANDNAPKFSKTRETIHVPESVAIGFSVANITATDPDEGLNGEVFYALLSGDSDSHFLFNNLTGTLKTNKLLDRERSDRYVLVIQARDKGTPSTSSLAFVTIFVDDVNDNAPVITTTTYSLTIHENLPPGQLVCKVSASDADDGLNKDISFSLNFAEFTVNSSGFVYTTESLDREKTAEYEIKIVASDRGTPVQSSFVVVKVTVGDTNDNYPVFERELYAVLISENMTVGSPVIQVSATDRDDDLNSELTYTMSGGHGHFKINRTTGLISMVTPVDHESNPGGFVIHVTASDRGIPREKSSTVRVNIGISDVNDNTPVFEKLGYETSVSEMSPLGTLVLRVSASDRDQGLLGEVTHAIIDGNVGDVFSVNDSGFIVISKKLDRETKQFYELLVKATDKAGIPKSALTKINIHVLDANDNPPMFLNAPVHLQVNETTPVNTVLFTLIASDPDLDKTNGNLSFDSLPGDGVLTLNSDTGAVSLVQSLSFAVKRSHVLQLFVRDHGVPVLRSMNVNVTLSVVHKDSNVPIFEYPSYTLNVTEDTAVNSTVGRVEASQRNPPQGSSIVYVVKSGNDREQFRINQLGIITLLKPLDRESHASYTLLVTATNSENASEVGHTVVNVIVTDVNDETPLFQFREYRGEVNENASVDTSVLTVRAFDPDIVVFAELQYRITSGHDGGKFKIETRTVDGNSVGVLSVGGALDRETKEFYKMELSVSDGQFQSNCTVLIKVNDFNDNSPIFNPSNYQANVPENAAAGFTVIIVTANDADIGENAKLSYSMTGAHGHFVIDESSGEIMTTFQSLDRETTSSYELRVTASDTDGFTDTASVTITVSDKNDNAPVFNPPSYATEVVEGPQSLGRTIVTVQATDGDSGVNSELVYSIKDGNVGGTFGINNITGVMKVSTEVDRELLGLSTNHLGHKIFALTFAATDKGQPPLTAHALVTILVGDINDNRPSFTTSDYSFMIAKDAMADMTVFTVTATDNDAGQNGRVTYEILHGNTGGDFTLDRNSGVLRTVNNLKRAVGFLYNLTVMARDQGSPSLSSNTTVAITVGENNDHSPVFDPQNYTISVYENNLPNVAVLNVTATDDDKGQNAEITYSISHGNNQSLFTLVTETNYGMLMVGRLDREMQDRYVLRIVAKDGGIPVARMATGFITVMVLDLNDNAPQFTNRNYTGTLAENSGPDIVVQMNKPIHAADRDLGINADIVYRIDGPGNEQFVIDITTAVLKTRDSPSPTLDYETNSSYSFNVIATDQAGNGLSSSVPVTINLTDENDNTPEFHPGSLHISISESTPVGDVITTVTAVDPDPGINGRVRYSIISGAEGMFAVERSNGSLRVLDELDREKHEKYRLNISAIDGNLYPRQGFGLVVITLIDANDNPPVFEQLEYTTTVSEGVPIGHDVLTVRAVDSDKGLNSNVSYSLTHPHFDVDGLSGRIRTTESLDRETVDSYSLSVRAQDTGGLATSVTVNIIVSDVNDNSPYFPKDGLYRTDVSEDSPVGIEVVWIVAQDADNGKNAELNYSLAQNVADLFEIDPHTGVIRLKNSLSKQQLVSQGLVNNTGLMHLTVQVRDGGAPARMSHLNPILKIVSAADPFPFFSQPYYHFNVSEDTEMGRIVGTVRASSKSNANVLQYSFSSEQVLFEINANSGQISTAEDLNVPDESYYIFTVIATDDLLNPGFTSVVVEVMDVNDHPPLFLFSSPYKMSIAEGERPGTAVGRLKAKDEDRGKNGKISYTFAEANVGPGETMVPIDNSCFLPLGLESEAVLASDMTASSSFAELNRDYSAAQGRLNKKPSSFSGTEYQGAWCAAADDLAPFLQVDFKRLKKITKVATQGLPGGISYVTKYQLSHSLDGNTWTAHEQLLSGNTDAESVVTRKLLPPFRSRYVRIRTLSWNNKSCLRVEFYGCNSDGGDDWSIPFIIDESSAMVNVSDELDRESHEKYTIVVQASDHGDPALRSNTTLELIIVDENDNAPVFGSAVYHVALSEHTFAGDVVVRITASDQDSGSNSELTYAIVSGGRDKFRIEASTGIIQPTVRLDYEESRERFFALNVSATDHGAPALSSYAAVVINITDFNDNYPVFNTSSLVAEIQENLNPATYVTRILATDADTGNNSLLRYSFIEGSVRFSLDPSSGVVRTSQRLDREEIGYYVIQVRATDSGASSLSTDATLLLKISDVNDNPPVFSKKTYTRRIQEDSAPGSIVVTVKADDKDTGLNGRVVYQISQGNEKGLFYLDNITGIVTVAKSLDREVNHTMAFTVVAHDQTPPFYSDEAEVVVVVTDVNDNAPVIEPKEVVVVISEDVAIGTFVADMNATDKDSSNNAQLEYSIIHGSSGHFSVDATSGVVRTAVQLDYEVTDRYTVLVMVRDTGVTGYMDFGSIDITLVDVNDNSPTFLMPIGPFLVSENQPGLTEVGIVKATDIDSGNNAAITFSIAGGDSEMNFVIGESSGVLSTTTFLDRESTSMYDLIIIANNSLATPALTSRLTVRVNIGDVNDNAPKFNASVYQGAVSENATVGETVARLFATDPDEGDAAMIVYRVINSSHPNVLSIDGHTGILILREPLIHEEYRNISVKVEAKDHGDPPLSSSVSVIIRVEDINDNPPRFDQRLYSASISELASVDDPVLQMIASDDDTDGSGRITYQLVYGNDLGHFKISAETGWVYVNEPLDRETVAKYRLGVRASNTVGNKRRRKRNAPFSDTVEVEINVDDVNDNVPVFMPLVYVGGVMPGADAGTLIVRLTATDADSGWNSQLAFNVSSGDDDRRFLVNVSGSILSTDVAVGSSGSLYNLKIVAIDNIGRGSASRKPAAVKIYVLFRPQQAVVLLHVDPGMVRNNTEEFVQMLSNITNSQAYIDKIYKVYTRGDQGNLQTSSEVLFHAVRNLTILSGDEIVRTVALNRHLLDTVYAKWNIRKVTKVHVDDENEDDSLRGWEIAVIVLAVILGCLLLFLCCYCLCCRRWKRQFSEETPESPKKTFFTNSPVTRQRNSSSDSTQFYISSSTGPLPFSQSQNITNPVYCPDLDSDGYEEKEMELSLSDEESDEESGKRLSKKESSKWGPSFKKSFRK